MPFRLSYFMQVSTHTNSRNAALQRPVAEVRSPRLPQVAAWMHTATRGPWRCKQRGGLDTVRLANPYKITI